MLKWLTALTVTLSLLGSPVWAAEGDAAKPAGDAKKDCGDCKHVDKLSEEDKAKVKAFHEQAKAKREALFEEQKKAREAVVASVKDMDKNGAVSAIKDTYLKNYAARKSLFTELSAQRKDVVASLSEEGQKIAAQHEDHFAIMLEKMAANHEKATALLDKLLADANLSKEDAMQQIKAAMEEARCDGGSCKDGEGKKGGCKGKHEGKKSSEAPASSAPNS